MKRHVDIAIKWADRIVPSAEMISEIEAAEAYAERLADVELLAKAANFLGQFWFYIGQLKPSIVKLQRVIGLADTLSDKDRVGSSYRCLGQLYMMGYSRCSDGLRY